MKISDFGYACRVMVVVMFFSSMASAITQITDRSLGDEVTRSKLPVVMEFYATWCGPCKVAAPLVEEAEKRLKGKVKFVKLDVDESPRIGHLVREIPTIAYINPNKKDVYMTSGVRSADEIVKTATEQFNLKEK
jgi:thioredoxin 1